MNNPFDYTPDAECRGAYRELVARLDALRTSEDSGDVDFIRELEAGKMLGVLIATDSCGARHTLYAFSGQLGSGGFHHEGFVRPVFDYLQPDGYFKTKEAEISRQSIEISKYENGDFSRIKGELERAEARNKAIISEFKEKCRRSKMARDARREAGMADEAELAAMTRQSQFEKAELHRLKKRLAADLEPREAEFGRARAHLERLRERRRADSEALQQWLFSNFKVLNALGESRSLSEIFMDTPMGVPPSGAGECCAPKLLHAAYSRGWQPVSIAEYWYGKPKGGEVRIHGEHYPACRGKCLPVLGWMLRGLCVEPTLNDDQRTALRHEPEVIYENRWFCVVSKPSGMLSVPGKSGEVSVEEWLRERYGIERGVKMAHRLDQDTSGLLVATFGSDSFKVMQSLFATRRVRKTYIALLEGDYMSLGLPRSGRIDLPLSPDWLDRPRQRVDPVDGKEAMTEYEFTEVVEGRSRVTFHPLTGRTHQLRIHAASGEGLGMPIVGDRLYGKNKSHGHGRLCLHAQKLEFTFPMDGRYYCFEAPVSF